MKPAPDYYVFPTDLHSREDLTTQHMLEVVPVVERDHYDLVVAENQELRDLLTICQGAVCFKKPSPERDTLLVRIKAALGETS